MYNFLYTTYTKSLKASADYYRGIPDHIFYPRMRDIVSDSFDGKYIGYIKDDKSLGVLSCRNVSVLEDELILGYSIFGANTLDFIFVKRLYRGKGLAKRLLLSTIENQKYYTMFLNKKNKDLLKNNGLNLVFNPYE